MPIQASRDLIVKNTSSKKPNFSEDDRGAVMIIGLFMAMALVGFTFFTIGVGKAFLFRERGQEAADSVAIGAAIIQARGMNVIASLNVFLLCMSYGFLTFRMMEATFFHLAQIIGVPAWGFGLSKYFTIATGEVSPRSFELGRLPPFGCLDLKTRNAVGHGDEMSVTVDDGSVSGLMNSGWACGENPTLMSLLPWNAPGRPFAPGQRFTNYLDRTGLNGSVPNDLPIRIVVTHNWIRGLNMFVEYANGFVVDAFVHAQDDAATNYAVASRDLAGEMAAHFDGVGSLVNMQNGGGARVTGITTATGHLPINTDINAGTGGADRTLASLCVRAAQDALFNASTVDRNLVSELPARNTASVINGGSFQSFRNSLFTTNRIAQDFWCDSTDRGAIGGANYWSTRKYAFFPDGAGADYENGGRAFASTGEIGGTLTDNNRKPQGVVGQVTAGTEQETATYFASAEFFYDCAAQWNDSTCNGRSSSAMGAASKDMTLFRPEWRARLIKAEGRANAMH